MKEQSNMLKIEPSALMTIFLVEVEEEDVN
jgi:hypothetical protein